MKLAEARSRKLLTIQELADVSGVSRANIYAIEAGKWLPSLRTIRKLSESLDADPIEIDEFLAGIEKSSRGKEPARMSA